MPELVHQQACETFHKMMTKTDQCGQTNSCHPGLQGLFQVQMELKSHCKSCKTVEEKVTIEIEENICWNLPLLEFTSLKDAMDGFLVPEFQQEAFQPTCGHRGNQTQVVRTLHSTSDVLVIHLNRVLYTGTHMQKITHPVTFPLAFKPIADRDTYDLSAVLRHHGLSPTSGHWTCYQRIGGKNVHKDDHHQPKEVSNEEVLEEGSLLFYVKRQGQQEPEGQSEWDRAVEKVQQSQSQPLQRQTPSLPQPLHLPNPPGQSRRKRKVKDVTQSATANVTAHAKKLSNADHTGAAIRLDAARMLPRVPPLTCHQQSRSQRLQREREKRLKDGYSDRRRKDIEVVLHSNSDRQLLLSIQEAQYRFHMALLVCPYLLQWTQKLWSVWNKMKGYLHKCRAKRLLLFLDTTAKPGSQKQVKGHVLAVTDEQFQSADGTLHCRQFTGRHANVIWNYGWDDQEVHACVARGLLQGGRVQGQNADNASQLSLTEQARRVVVSLQIPTAEYTHEDQRQHCFLYDLFEESPPQSSSSTVKSSATTASAKTCTCPLCVGKHDGQFSVKPVACYKPPQGAPDDRLSSSQPYAQVASGPPPCAVPGQPPVVFAVPAILSEETPPILPDLSWALIRAQYEVIHARAESAEVKGVAFSKIAAGRLSVHQGKPHLVARGRCGGALGDCRSTQWCTPDHAEWQTMLACGLRKPGAPVPAQSILIVTTVPCPSCCRMLSKYCCRENIKAIVFGDSSAVQLDGLQLLQDAGVTLFHDPVL